MSKDYYEEFIDSLLGAIQEALETGKPFRLQAGGKHEVTIDIYETKSQMKNFNEMITATAKDRLGISVAELVKEPK